MNLRLRRLVLAISVGLLLTTSIPGPVAAQSVPYSRYTPFALWEVPIGDLPTVAKNHKLIVKAFDATMNPVRYLDAARAYGLKVVVYFSETVDYKSGTIHPSKIAPRVEKVKGHPALYGYLSVKEPSWWGISLSEMRTLYKTYRALDPYHRVIALLGDTPHFGTSRNPWGTGVANMLWVNWYPVTCYSGYYTGAAVHFPKVRAYVEKVTPWVPLWLMVQGHEYRKGNKCTPTTSQLTRQVYEGFKYLKAEGILWYTWNNPMFDRDLKRTPTLQTHMVTIMSKVRNLTF